MLGVSQNCGQMLVKTWYFVVRRCQWCNACSGFEKPGVAVVGTWFDFFYYFLSCFYEVALCVTFSRLRKKKKRNALRMSLYCLVAWKEKLLIDGMKQECAYMVLHLCFRCVIPSGIAHFFYVIMSRLDHQLVLACLSCSFLNFSNGLSMLLTKKLDKSLLTGFCCKFMAYQLGLWQPTLSQSCRQISAI